MMLNARQKAGMVVLALGVAALVVDRAFVLPRSAPASERRVSSDYRAVPTIGRQGMAPAPPAESTTLTVARKLEAAWSDKDLSLEAPRDLFSLPGSWSRDPEPEIVDHSLGRAGASFVATYKLEAIIVDEEGKRASIDDRLLRLGDRLDGYELVVIDSESVVFERDGERIELRLEKRP
jgi:hypothetical protein